MKELCSIKYWIFDLDNTLYSEKTRVFEQVDKKMSKYISEKLNVNIARAKEIQKNYFHEYNTTLNGMIKNHKIDANEFLEFVHDIDVDFLKDDPILNKELEKLVELEKKYNAKLITTEKDYLRIKSLHRRRFGFVPIKVKIDKEDELIEVIKKILK